MRIDQQKQSKAAFIKQIKTKDIEIGKTPDRVLSARTTPSLRSLINALTFVKRRDRS